MSLSKDLVFLMLQFCDEENLKRTAHMLEQETGYFFDLKYFGELVINGNWDEAEKYLSSFTVVEDNKYSTKIYFEIRKQKFLETLEKNDHGGALDILLKDLKVFAQSNKELYKEMAQLLVLDDFRKHSSLASYGDTLSARKKIQKELRTLIEVNPLLQGKTRFPQVNKSRLRRLINQSLNWQHIHCAHPHPQPHIDTLFTDHKCPGPDTMQDQLNEDSTLSPMAMAMPASPLVGNSASTPSSATESIVNALPVNLGNLSYQAFGISLDASNPKVVKSLEEVACQGSTNGPPSEFPRTVERVLNIGASLTSMDFHPVTETLLLVGKSTGDIELWDVSSAQKFFTGQYKVGEATPVSGILLEKTENNHGISVNCVRWSPDGSLFGVAYSQHVIHLYNGNGNHYEKKYQIVAHNGSVNDLAFSKPYDRLLMISCGDDKLIQVWEAASGAKCFTFEGHWDAVYSLCPHTKENLQFLFSVSRTGEIKAWLFDKLGSRITYDAPGLSCMRMAYSSDGKRLFSCGTNINGESYIVEWNESEGFILRNYIGLGKCSSAIVQFDTCINRFLAAGDEHLIKIWDMDNAEMLAIIDVDGGLPASPYICFNNKGSLLAVSTENNQIKILVNDHGRELLQKPSCVSGNSSRCLRESFAELSVDTKTSTHGPNVVGRDGTTDQTLNALVNLELDGHTEMEIPKIVEVSSCQFVLLTSEVHTEKIRRLVYTHAGDAILALEEDGALLHWRWPKSAANLSGQATTKCDPRLWQPKSGSLMLNGIPKNSMEVVTHCLSLSKNDSYIITASGRSINLFSVMMSKKMKCVMRPPPAATCLMFYPPDNNIIAIGMDDATILIYNVRLDEVITKLKGHSRRVTGLAFSTNLNVLVSCGVDTEIVLWDSVRWEIKKRTVLQISMGWQASAEWPETHVELDKDENHFLAVHETQLAIYETATLRRVKQWTIAQFCTRVSHATYSCDSQLVYAVMTSGILLILHASDLTPRFEIDPLVYYPSHFCADPIVVAAHPHKPYQFAVGLSEGGIVVIEPPDSQPNWTIHNV